MFLKSRQRHFAPFASSMRLVALIAALLFSMCAIAELLLPEAPGDTTYKKSGTTIDASHADQGYIMVKQKKTGKKLKMRISLGSETLTYDLNSDGEYEVFPLQLGSGKYKVQIYSQVSGNKYSAVSSLSFKAEVADETFPFLYPNQYVNYDADTLAIAQAEALCGQLSGAREKFDAVYQYVTTHIVYDYIRALTVKTGYLPDLDDVYTQRKGICFDFASLMACMLRTQGVSTKVVIGYADQTYHAWNEVYIDGAWVRCDATSAASGAKVKQYTTERVY